jgi:ribulose-5-phosphate 4-epimerase/fuculose-1-phosphate aldolase
MSVHSIHSHKGSPKSPLNSQDLHALKSDLAAAFRLAVHFGWEEAVGNHFSAACSADGRTFLLNPRWQHFSTIRASDLQTWQCDDSQALESSAPPDPSAWCLHGTLHSKVPEARVLLHVHPPFLTALMALKDPSIKPVDQNTARFFERCVIDHEYGGLADDQQEADRVAALLVKAPIVLMGNHGVMVSGDSVALAFDELYFLERAARTLVYAYQTGQPLKVLSDEVARRTSLGWVHYEGAALAHFEHLKNELRAQDPSFEY